MNKKQTRTKINEKGFAALVVAITLVLVLSLITVGFATLMRKEQRSALDKHLSRQAFFAAESGINDVKKAIQNGYNAAKTECGPLTTSTVSGSQFLSNNQVGESGDGLSYTCLLIDPTPPNLEYSIAANDYKAFQITGINPDTDAPTNISRIDISWEGQGSGAATPFINAAGHAFPPAGTGAGAWSAATGVIRASFMPMTSGCLNRDCMVASTHTSYLYPKSSGSTPAGANVFNAGGVNPTDSINGKIFDGNCNQAGNLDCEVSLRNLVPSPDYFLNLRSIYQNNRVILKAYDNTNRQLRIANAQIMVDSTGKAQDVLRRIQVRLPVTDSYGAPVSALEVMNGICKQLELAPNADPLLDSERNNCTP